MTSLPSFSRRIIVFAVLLFGVYSLNAAAADQIASAEKFIDCMASQQFAKAKNMFDPALKNSMPPGMLAQGWNSVLQKSGPFQKRTGARVQKQAGYDVVYVTCQFKKDTQDAKVVFSGSGQIAGLWFEPATVASAPKATRPANISEQEVIVGKGTQWELPGILSKPVGAGPFPAVVLVHGSGPHDRDETVGANKPFRDLAWGLAERGIAVLRYEKRTKAHPLACTLMSARLTVNEETVDDALAAVQLLRETPGIDPGKVFVLGHSLGGMLIPRIGQADEKIAGLIVLAGTSRPFGEVIVEQYEYLFSLDGLITKQESAELQSMKAKAARTTDATQLANAKPADLPFGVPASYWLDLLDYDPPSVAQALNNPMLILQGDRDYQVTMKDFERWQSALGGRPNVEFKVFHQLNHLFMQGQGKSAPAEYNQPGQVSNAVIEHIANWMRKISAS